jgi:SAM-dependent methyltransferase
MQKCRSCGAPLTHSFVDLGLSPISNAFVRPDDALKGERFYPLKTFVCSSCFLVQVADIETPNAHFHEHYVYFSSQTPSWVAHAQSYCDMAVARFGLGASSQVVEVACNDGYLLQHFIAAGVPCLGVEPSGNVAQAARQKGIKVESAFFGLKTAQRLRDQGVCADLMVANNVLAHVPDLNDFVAGFALLLKPSGTITFEFPHLASLMQDCQYDTIYHEHYSYLSLTALRPLFARHGLVIVEAERLPTHGGSLRVYVQHQGAAAFTGDMGEEALDRLEAYAVFSERVKAHKRALLSLLISLKEQGKRIVAYGAPAKGVTLLNFCGIGTDFLDFAVDRSPAKQGLLMPGVQVPVYAPERLFEAKPDYVLILPWNLAGEIMDQLAAIRDWGGRFLVPIPQPAVF